MKKKFEVKTAFLYRCILELPHFEYVAVWWDYISRRGRGWGGEGEPLMSNLCLISHYWYNVEKLTVHGSSNLNFKGHSKKFCVKKMKEKWVTFCFIKLNAKASPKSSGEGWLFCTENRSLLSKLIFTHIVSCWSRSHEIVEK